MCASRSPMVGRTEPDGMPYSAYSSGDHHHCSVVMSPRKRPANRAAPGTADGTAGWTRLARPDAAQCGRGIGSVLRGSAEVEDMTSTDLYRRAELLRRGSGAVRSTSGAPSAHGGRPLSGM